VLSNIHTSNPDKLRLLDYAGLSPDTRLAYHVISIATPV